MEVGDAHVLGHLDGGDDVEEQLLLGLARVLLGEGGGHLAVVAHEDLALALLELVRLVGLGQLLLDVVVAAPLGALLAQRHADRLGAELLGRPAHERAPAAADVEVAHARLEQVHLLADHVELVLLRLLERLLGPVVEGRGVDLPQRARAEA